MKNRFLRITRNAIPYVRELNEITGGMVASILMTQIDYWSDRYPNGFYKFLAPSPDHPRYRPGQSWVEELGISDNEFRTAFDQIGFRYKSKGEFVRAEDKFKGRMYCSYVDRRENLTYYLRNHEIVDARLDALMMRIAESTPPAQDAQAIPGISAAARANLQETRKVDLREMPNEGLQGSGKVSHGKLANRMSGDQVPAGQEIPVAQVGERTNEGSASPRSLLRETEKVGHHDTEPTEEPNKYPQPQPTASPAVRGGGCSEPEKLIYPDGLHEKELTKMRNIILLCPIDRRQDVLDEAEGIRRIGGVKRGIIPLVEGLVRRVATGEFTLSLGISVQAQREADIRIRGAAQRAPLVTTPTGKMEEVKLTSMSDDDLKLLPENMRRLALEARGRASVA